MNERFAYFDKIKTNFFEANADGILEVMRRRLSLIQESNFRKMSDEIDVLKTDVYEKLECKIEHKKFIELASNLSKKPDSDKVYEAISKLKSDVYEMLNGQAKEFKQIKNSVVSEIYDAHRTSISGSAKGSSTQFSSDMVKMVESIWKELKRLQSQRDVDVNKYTEPSPTNT